MLESINAGNLQYTKLTPEEMQSRGILGRLVGDCADFIRGTRNGRKYSEELWEKVFENPIMQEKIKNRVCYGELNHPQDRQETDIEKVAVCLAEVPKKGKDGKLKAVFDILSTPNGKLLKTLCDYGSNLGISSRGSGDVIEDFNGEESVDPDTYQCEGWDVVILPAVESARLKYVTESFNTNRRSLKEALETVVENANEDEKKIMSETIQHIESAYSTKQEEDNPEKVEDIDANVEHEDAGNAGNSLVNDLQEALKDKQRLEEQLAALQEKLSVSYAKEAELKESLSQYKTAIGGLVRTAKKVGPLETKISTLSAKLVEKENTIKSQEDTINNLRESKETISDQSKSLNETLSNKNKTIIGLEKQISTLNENIKMIKSENVKELETLNENIEELKKDSSIKHEEYSKKLKHANGLVEKYKTTAKVAVNKYIESKSIILGVSKKDILNKLSEGFSFEDIDKVCEELQEYKVNISKLPFNFNNTNKTNIKMKITESKEPIKPANRFDDELDDQLKNLAGI